MSFFDFFFPEQAQASHLRKLVAQGQAHSSELHRQRLNAVQQQREESAKNLSLEQRVQILETELGQAALTIEALLELLEQRGVMTRAEFASRAQEIDSRDGIADGRITPLRDQPFSPKHPWPGK